MTFITEPFYNREKTKTKQKIHNRQKKTSFITEPFYNREVKKKILIDPKQRRLLQNLFTTERKQKQIKDLWLTKKKKAIYYRTF
jgi:hypothetical protein